MKFSIPTYVACALAAVCFIASIMLFARLPDHMASHWDLNNTVDGTLPKQFGAFLIPVILILMTGFINLIKKINPRKNNIERSSGAISALIVILSIALTIVHISMLAYAMNVSVNIGKIVFFCMGLLFAVSGNYLGKTRSNFMFGIKSPWTLSSERVWDKTHRLGGKIMVLEGVLFIIAALFFTYTPQFLTTSMALVIGTLFGLYFYSYFVYRSEQLKQ